MHETHLLEPIIRGIAEHAKRQGAKRVTKVRLKIGALLGVKEISIKETFSMLTKRTILEVAELEVMVFPGTIIQVVSFDVE